jgi:hypothetical protein
VGVGVGAGVGVEERNPLWPAASSLHTSLFAHLRFTSRYPKPTEHSVQF